MSWIVLRSFNKELREQERMARIAVVDDDHSAESLIDYLIGRGHEVQRFASATDALAGLTDLAGFDLVILDVMMARPEKMQEERAHGGFRTGLVLAHKLRSANSEIPILALSATQDAAVSEWFANDRKSAFISKLTAPSARRIHESICSLLGIEEIARTRNAFIVHGHDEVAKLGLKNYLQNTLRFPEPTILHEKPSGGKTIIEKFEYYSAQSDFVFVLLTPDDVVCNGKEPDDVKRRARQNVIFELGYFLGVLGRESGRVFLLHKGDIDLPSDIAGVIYIDITAGIDAAGETLRREVANVK